MKRSRSPPLPLALIWSRVQSKGRPSTTMRQCAGLCSRRPKAKVGLAVAGTASSSAYKVGKSGYYVCAAQVRIDSMSRSYYVRLIISINGDKDVNNGLHAIQGNRGSTNYRSLKVAGTVWLNVKDSVSVMVYTNGDHSWNVNHESGFSCHMISTFACTKCPARSTGPSIEAGCTWEKGTKGAIIPSSKGRRYTGSCKRNNFTKV